MNWDKYKEKNAYGCFPFWIEKLGKGCWQLSLTCADHRGTYSEEIGIYPTLKQAKHIAETDVLAEQHG